VGKNIIDPSDLSTGRLLVDKINQVKQQAHVQTDPESQMLYADLAATGETILRAHYPYLNETGKARYTQIRRLTKRMRADAFTWDEEAFRGLKGLLDSIPTVENFCFDLTVDVFPGISREDLSALFFTMDHNKMAHLITAELSSRCRNPCAFCNCGRHESKMQHIPFIMFIKAMKYLDTHFNQRVSILPYMHSNAYDYHDKAVNATFADIVDGLKKPGQTRDMSLNVDPTDFAHSGIMEHVGQRVRGGVAISLHTMHDYTLKRYAWPFYRGLISSYEAERVLAGIKAEYLKQYRAAISQALELNGTDLSVVVHASPSQLAQVEPVPEAVEAYAEVWRKYPKVKAIFDRLTRLQTEVVDEMEKEFSFPRILYRVDRQVDRAFVSARLKPGVVVEDFRDELRQRLKDFFYGITHSQRGQGEVNFDHHRGQFVDYLKRTVVAGVSPKDLVEILQYCLGHDYVASILPHISGFDAPKAFRLFLRQAVASFYSRVIDWSLGTSDYLQGHWADWLVDKFGMTRKDFESLMYLHNYGQNGSDIYSDNQSDITINPAGEIVFNGFERQAQRFRKVGEMFADAQDPHFRQLVRFLQIVAYSRDVQEIDNNLIGFAGNMRDSGLGLDRAGYTDIIVAMPKGCYYALKAGYFSGNRLGAIVGSPGSYSDYAAVYAALKNVPIPIQLEFYASIRSRAGLLPVQPMVYQLITEEHSEYGVNIYSALNRFTLPVKVWAAGSEFVEPVEDKPSEAVVSSTPVSSGSISAHKGGVDWQNAGAQIKLEGKRAQFLTLPDSVTIDPKTFCGFNGQILAWETIDKEE